MLWRKAAFVHFQATRGVGKSKAIEVSQENIPCPPCGKGRESTKLFDLDCPRWYIPIGVFSLQSRFLGLFHLQIGIFLKFWVGGFEEFASKISSSSFFENCDLGKCAYHPELEKITDFLASFAEEGIRHSYTATQLHSYTATQLHSCKHISSLGAKSLSLPLLQPQQAAYTDSQ